MSSSPRSSRRQKVGSIGRRASAGTSAGPGVVIADGRVLTNAHNVRGEQVTVTFADGRSHPPAGWPASTSTASSP